MPYCTACANKPEDSRRVFGGAMMCPCEPPDNKECAGDGERSSTAEHVCDACASTYGICQECGNYFTDENPMAQE